MGRHQIALWVQIFYKTHFGKISHTSLTSLFPWISKQAATICFESSTIPWKLSLPQAFRWKTFEKKSLDSVFQYENKSIHKLTSEANYKKIFTSYLDVVEGLATYNSNPRFENFFTKPPDSIWVRIPLWEDCKRKSVFHKNLQTENAWFLYCGSKNQESNNLRSGWNILKPAVARASGAFLS